SCKSQFVFVQRLCMCIQANRIFRQVRGELCRYLAHAAPGHRYISLAEHLENKLKHPARGFHLAIEQDAAEKRAKKAMDELVGKAGRLQSILGRRFWPVEELLDRRSPQSCAQLHDAKLVPQRAAVGAESRAPAAASPPGID